MTYSIAKIDGSFDRSVASERTAEVLLARRAHYGITRVTEITGLDDLDLPVHCAIRPRSRSATTISTGKGLTASDSLVSALAEAVEVDCAERFAPTDRVFGTYDDLHLTYPMFAPDAGVPGGRGVPRNVRLEWVWVDDLLAPPAARRGLLPVDFVRQGNHGGPLLATTLSNGLASGNVLEEALNHALEELIERDAAASFSYRARYCDEELRGKYRRIALGSLPPRAAGLVEKCLSAGRQISLVDATSDIPVPVVLCVIVGGGIIGVGMGASPNSERAAIRAITEAAQSSTVQRQGTREDLDVELRDPRVHERDFGLECKRVVDVFDDRLEPTVALSDLPSSDTRFVDEDLARTLGHLRARRIRNVFMCDVSDDECGSFRVVRVVAPDLESQRLDTIGRRRLRHALRA